MPVPRESEIQRSIVAFLEARGAVVVRANSGSLPRADGGRMTCTRSTAGSVSDLLACYRGRFLALEVKRPGGKLTEGQSEFLDATRRAGGIGAVVRSVDDVARLLAEVDARKVE